MSDSDIENLNDDKILVRGAREHNLKAVNVDIPRNKITVITGLSGSGKSSLAFDTIYAEGQRRYLESLSAYARQFMDQLKKPEVDSIVGLSPSIAIDQKTNVLNPRSTVGTTTEIYDFLRLLFARVGTPFCPTCQIPVANQTPKEIYEELCTLPEGSKFLLLSPVAQGKKGEFKKEISSWIKKGFVNAKIDGNFVELSSIKQLAKTKVHDIDLVIDKLIIKDKLMNRLRESLNTALNISKGSVFVEFLDGKRHFYSIHAACSQCGYSFPPIEPRFFSFNNARGACQTCNGIGFLENDANDDEESAELSEETELDNQVCPDCHGARIRHEALMVKLAGKNIVELATLSVAELLRFIEQIRFNKRQNQISEKIIKEIRERIHYLLHVGVPYLSLNRSTRSLSGGEAQRIRLASQLGSSLVGVLYVLDEPSIGLHPRDHQRLLEVLKQLRDLGNTVLLVEHDEDTIRSADYLIDMGPGAGKNGGFVISKGSPQAIQKDPASITGQYLSGKKSIPLPTQRRLGSGNKLVLKGATGNNLKNVTVEFPLGKLIVVTGVSGSGKSTLIIDSLYRALHNHFYSTAKATAPFRDLQGLEHLDKVVEIDQKPIGRTPRSNPASYIDVLPLIRNLFAAHPEARMRGYTPGRFSFNMKGGRCEDCQGAGTKKIEMHFLPNVYVQCDTCNGKRFNRETLSIKYKNKSIADILAMSVDEALPFFQNHKHIHKKLDTLHRTGLDYISLGQASTTLSGGEAQRIKLSKELSKKATGKTLYILDEPTTGLHFADVAKLIQLLQELVDQGNTVIIIEHNLEVIKSADHIIDVGPEGGIAGGEIIATGTPEQIGKNSKSITGKFLKLK